jgi:hypothetical protein
MRERSLNNMEKEMTFEETNAKVQEWFYSIQDEFLRTKPMWLRLGYISNLVAQMLSHGHTDEDILWDKVNEYLSVNVDEYDFNCFDKITSSQQLFEANERARTIPILGIGNWQKHVCKDCEQTFYMTYGEVKFFEEKELHIPKRCKFCRKARKERYN